MGMFDFMNPQKVVSDVTESVTTNGGNFLSNLIFSPFRAISGFAHGVMDSLWNGVKYTGIILGVKTLAPTLWNAGVEAVQGPQALAALKEHRVKDGLPGLVLDSAKDGFGLAAVIGGTSGAFNSAGDGVASKLGAGVVMASVAAVTIGALHKNEVNMTDGNVAFAQVPTTPSVKPKTEQAKS